MLSDWLWTKGLQTCVTGQPCLSHELPCLPVWVQTQMVGTGLLAAAGRKEGTETEGEGRSQ